MTYCSLRLLGAVYEAGRNPRYGLLIKNSLHQHQYELRYYSSTMLFPKNYFVLIGKHITVPVVDFSSTCVATVNKVTNQIEGCLIATAVFFHAPDQLVFLCDKNICVGDRILVRQ